MTDQMKDLQGYVNDMLAVETELHAAFRRQKADAEVKKFPAAHQLVARAEEVIDQHLATLKSCAARLGGESALKKAVGSVLGAAAGLYDKIRGDAKVSRVLRDDNTALTFASVSYQMLHTTALAMRDEATAEMALKHMRDYTPIIVDSSQVLTQVLAEELSQEGKAPLDRSVVEEANRHAREAWSQGSSLH